MLEGTIYLNKKPKGDVSGPPPTSASAIVEEDKKAKVDGARIQTPFIGPQTQEDSQKAANKRPSLDDLLPNVVQTAKTNAKTPTLSTTDRITEGDAVGLSTGDKGTETVTNKDSTEENVSGGVNSSEVDVAEEFKKDIIPKESPFKGFATMTYGVSLYLMGVEQYAGMISSGKKSVKGLTLLLQSGGISKAPEGNHGARRSSNYFKQDFYIDDIELKGLISGTSVSSPHNQFETSFTVIEPNGLTFLEELHGIVQEHNISNGVSKDRINYAAQNYLMVVRFYGYDKNGKQITGRDIGVSESLSDLSSISEKFIPFQFTGIQFAIENAEVRYKCNAVCPQTQIPFGVANSTITFNAELYGQTVSAVLTGKLSNEDLEKEDELKETQLDDAEVDVIYDQNVSLVDALNTEQSKLLKNKSIEVPHKYVIEFEKGSNIGKSLVITTGEHTDKDNVPMMVRNQQSMLTNKGFFDKNKRLFSFTAGQSIVQAIDMILRASTFISNQQEVTMDEVTGKVTKNESASDVLQWYKIRTQVTPIKYDSIRHNYAYEIKYVISRYQVNNIRSPYYGPTRFRGVHKEYDYWFTGKNTEVLDFRQEYNYLYYQTFGGDMGIPKLQNNAREITQQVYQHSSSESAQGGKNRRAEGAANAASLLYSPSDQANAQLQIVGDPDWIAQSEVFYSPDASGVGLGPFMDDGSVNYDASEVLFSVNYNTNVDYDLKSGIADVGNKNHGRDLSSGKGGKSRMSLIYRANTITTSLSGGKFTQTLEGTMMQFPTEEQLAKEKAEKEILSSELDAASDTHMMMEQDWAMEQGADFNQLMSARQKRVNASKAFSDELDAASDTHMMMEQDWGMDKIDKEGDFDRLMRLRQEGRDD